MNFQKTYKDAVVVVFSTITAIRRVADKYL